MNREFAVGSFFIIVTLMLGYLVSLLSQNRRLFNNMTTYYSLIKDSTGLLPGASVQVAGIEVGRLKDKQLINNRAKLSLEITPEVKIHEDAQITIRSVGYLGDRYIHLNLGSTNLPELNERAYIPAREDVTVEGVMEKGSDLISLWSDVAIEIRSLLGAT